MATIVAAQDVVGMDHLLFDAKSVRFGKPNMALTLNGIAQGFITDRIVALLKSEGVSNAVVNMGEIAALGRNHEGKPWQIRLAENDGVKAEQRLSLRDQCVATSAAQGTTFHGLVSHIINPMDGKPAQPSWRRVSIVHNSATIADGLSTAFVLMNADEVRDAMKQYGDMQFIAKSMNGKLVRFSS